MDTIQLTLWIVVGICMFFVGRALGYREAMQDLARGIATNVRVQIEEVLEEEEEQE